MFASPNPPFLGGRITLPLRDLPQLAGTLYPIGGGESRGVG